MSKSLSEVNQSVNVNASHSWWRKLFGFMGPAYMVSVGYMDPGNWATDIAGGSGYGYALLWVLLMSNLMALLLQSLSARMGLVAGLDLAQASKATYPKFVNISLYILAEIAIAACDLAEVVGMAIGLNLLFNIPLLAGVLISVGDTFLLLFMLNFGIRKMEAFILSLVAIIGASFLVEMILAKPDLPSVMAGLIPSIPNEDALYIAIGIIGATVMPHTLYLHSSLVQTRKFDRSKDGILKAIKYNIIDSVIALNMAFFVNAAILILAASTFFKVGLTDIAEIQEAHKLLAPLIGSDLAPTLFAIALIAAGQSSTITGTLAGQIIMEGYLNLRIQPWIRRILTRILAIIPALITITYFGEAATGKLLILSQVVLSMQLGFAVIPLIHFVSDKTRMKDFTISLKTRIAAWASALIIVSLNIKLVIEVVGGWLNDGQHNIVIIILVYLLLIYVAGLLIYITFAPFIKKSITPTHYSLHGKIQNLSFNDLKGFKKIAITVDFSSSDINAINSAIQQGGTNAAYCLIHCVETAGAIMLGEEIEDEETKHDKEQLEHYLFQLQTSGYKTSYLLGHGRPKDAIPKLTKEFEADILVMGSHGHRTFKDIILGTTIDDVRHAIDVPVLVVR